MTCKVFDERSCNLGEGALWHPLRHELFWFDITGRRLLARGAAGASEWTFDEMFSAAGWIDERTLLVASETGLWRFNLPIGSLELLCALDAENPQTRSNDGRADPFGGLWIGTMGKAAEPGAGAIWRWWRGELRRLVANVTIPNAICFSPDGQTAYFTDTPTRQVLRTELDSNGWPAGPPEVFVDLNKEGLNPDGAVVDGDGGVWIAQWGAGRIAAYGPNGQFRRAIEVPAPNVSCPAFGGPDFTTLFCTTARQGMTEAECASFPQAGQTFAVSNAGAGRLEPRVRFL